MRTTAQHQRVGVFTVVAALLVASFTGFVLNPAAAVVVTDLNPDEANIVVKVGNVRSGQGIQDVTGLAGVTLGAYSSAAASGSPIATCLSDTDGDCNLIVSGLDGTPTQFWVASVSVPAGYFANASLRTGPGNGSQSVSNPYVFPVTVSAGDVVRSTADFMYQPMSSSAPQEASNGVWQVSLENPPLPQNCGYNVAVVLDLSASLGSRISQLKAATNAFVDALVGTPSSVAIFSFDAASPASGGANYPVPLPVRTPAEAAVFKAQYADWTTGSGTNWDQALWRVAQATPTYGYDVVITLTDGNPTRYGVGQGTGGTTHFADVEAGIFSANSIKATGARHILMGVGSNLDEISELNLKALSGPVDFDPITNNIETADYYRLAAFSDAGSALQDLALAGCEQRLVVSKQIVPSNTVGEDITGAYLAGAGWQFDGTTTTPGATITDPVGGQAVTTNDGTGSVTYQLELTGVTAADVTVSETQQPGYDLVTQQGANAVCVDRTANDQQLSINNSSTDGFTVVVGQDSFVQCTVYNREPPASSVTVNKQWLINDNPVANGRQPSGVSAQLRLSEPDAVDTTHAMTSQGWGVTRPQYAENENVRFDEVVSITNSVCRLTRSEITEFNGAEVALAIPAGGYTADLVTTADTYTITNTVECDASVSPVVPTATATASGLASVSPLGLANTGFWPWMLVAIGVAVGLAGGIVRLWLRRQSLVD